jgi:3-isopropylmalate/(R)-2-methylmalate dehydratase large subunit
MEGRMTICNMSIEAGARAGMVAPDDTTFAYLEGRPGAPTGAGWERALDDWRRLPSDEDSVFDREVEIDVRELAPQVTWGTNPGMVAPVDGRVARSGRIAGPGRPSCGGAALTYMELEPGRGLPRSRSTACSSAPARTRGSRTCVLQRRSSTAARVTRGARAGGPGSAAVRRQAERKGSTGCFLRAGFEVAARGLPRCVSG